MKSSLLALTLAFSSAPAFADDNGKAITPPMGWRSWNLYGKNVNQKLIEGIMDGMVRKTRTVDGKPTSLCDLGYCDVGLDDNWQTCTKGADGKDHYHDEDGNPVVNLTLFPDFKKMTDYAHSLGLTSGWYGNNCICLDKTTGDKKFYEGDVKALRKYGFDSWKLDGCGAQTDLQLFKDLMLADGGKAITVENCHWGWIKPFKPNATWCPWNLYRTSGDVRAKYSSVVGNLKTVLAVDEGLSRPGCWAYPDMLEVGCQHGPGGAGDPGLNLAETRTHFGAWAIVSSPLVLSHDVNNDTIMDAVWPVIANPEAISINQGWAGHSGGEFKNSTETVVLDSTTNWAAMHKDMAPHEVAELGPTVSSAYQYLYKHLVARTAVLLMNNADTTADLELNFADIPDLICDSDTGCKVRDVWARKDLGYFHKKFTAKGLVSHDSAFLVITPYTPPPL